MKHALVAAGFAIVVAAGSAALPYGTTPAPKTARVMVHCPTGGRAGFVTPDSIRIVVGDSIEWRMTGEVTSDSLIITLKNPQQAWPFAGALPKGGPSARTLNAVTTGTYGYNVGLRCRTPNGGSHPVVIDPDIIIE